MTSRRSAFTLIELLVVIAVIAVLAVVVVITLNPAQLIQQSRDSNRLSDLANLQTAINLFQADQPALSLGNASSIYVSIYDPSATSTAGDQCQGLNLPAAPAGYTYQCAASSSYRNINGTGWIPLNLGSLSAGSPFSILPIDPINQTSSGLYYTYVTNGTQYEVTSIFESQKYKSQYGSAPLVPFYPDLNGKGSSLSINPLWNPSGLVGYWPLNEGTGSSTQDQSGNGNNGTWKGTAIGGTYYTSGAKIPYYAGNFDGTSNYALLGTANILPNAVGTVTAWVLINASATFNQYIISKGADLDGAAWGLNFYIPSAGQMNISLLYNSGWASSNNIPFVPGTWYQIAAVMTASNTQQLYFNGVQQTCSVSQPCTRSTFSPGSGFTFTIGGNGGARYMLNGSIDDVRVYNRAFSAAEIQALYNAEK